MKIEMYSRSTPYCPYCVRAKAMLEQFNKQADVYDVSVDPTKLDELKSKYPSARTFPVVVVDGKHIGGSKELREMLVAEQRKSAPVENVMTTFNGLSL